MPRTSTVRSTIDLHLVVPGGPPLPVPAELTYEASDPWAVRVAFHTGEVTGADGEGEGVIEWLFSRQLVADGLKAPAGEGDVRIWPSTSQGDAVVELSMVSPSGSALFEVDRDALVAFLRHTCLVVPPGSELDGVDLDAELALLLAT